MQEEQDEDLQCLSDDTDTELSTQVCVFRIFEILHEHLKDATPDFSAALSLRMPGSVQSAKSTTHLFRDTASAAGLCGKTGLKMSLASHIPCLSLTSRRAVLSPPKMTMTATQASTFQTAPGPCPTQSSCPPTLKLTDHCPPWA